MDAFKIEKATLAGFDWGSRTANISVIVLGALSIIFPSVPSAEYAGDRMHMTHRKRMKSSLCVWGPATARDCLTTPRILGDNSGSIQ
jgi:hypothetical protein